jgi:hypothetical protein
LQASEVALLPDNARSVAVLLQVRHGFLGMFLGIVQDHNFGGIVLEQMNDDSVSDAGAGASNYVDLCRSIQVS